MPVNKKPTLTDAEKLAIQRRYAAAMQKGWREPEDACFQAVHAAIYAVTPGKQTAKQLAAAMKLGHAAALKAIRRARKGDE
jgi:hypothetical protein